MGSATLRIAVYNRYWSTAGGGEVHAGSLAESLARRHDVELLSETDIDTEHLDTHLGLSLSKLACRVLGELDDEQFEAVTAEYDAFFNCTFSSARRNAARYGAYLVYFPPVDVSGVPPTSLLGASAARVLRAGLDIEWRSGVHAEEREGDRRWRWTEGEARLRVRLPAGRAATLRLVVSAASRPDRSAPLDVSVDGREIVANAVVGVEPFPIETRLVGTQRPLDVTIRTAAFRPADVMDTTDTRELGVQIERVELFHDRLPHRLVRRVLPSLAVGATDDFLETYPMLLANSDYTKRWIRRLWGRSSMTLEPPVRPRAGGAKKPMILSVGRFFAPENGHSKRQLEMIEAFGEIAKHGWELHLVGGCSTQDQPYLDAARRAADGLPVHFHVNAPARDVDELYASASIYWQATGLGEDSALHPERFEHFGISVVEAMSAGAVPVVHAVGGPAATVRAERDGLHFANAQQLVQATRRLIEDESLRAKMSTSARSRAEDFGRPAFDARVDRLLSRLR